MKEFEIISRVKEYASIDELNDPDKDLLAKAKEALKKAYAPYSDFFVGAAVLLESGETVIGNNQENIAYPVGLCAERVALFSAASQFDNIPVTAIAVSATHARQKTSEPITPCGSCRQTLAEYESRQGNDIRIIMQGDEGSIYMVDSVKDLLPLTFSIDILKKK